MTPRDAALFWLSQGVATVPLLYQSKKPVVPWTPYKSRLPALAEIDAWYHQRRNIALVSGWQNLVVLDFDAPECYAAWYTWQLIHNPKIINTYRVSSNRGVHVYFYLREPVKLRSIQSALFEVKSAGRLVTIPPSVHESGRRYTALDDPENIQIVNPEQILNYSSIELIAPIVFPTRSNFAPGNDRSDKNVVARIKESISILSFFPTARQVNAEGQYWLGDCPFHGHKANFWLDKRTNSGGCYAGCGTFDVISFYARLHKISNSEAIGELKCSI